MECLLCLQFLLRISKWTSNSNRKLWTWYRCNKTVFTKCSLRIWWLGNSSRRWCRCKDNTRCMGCSSRCHICRGVCMPQGCWGCLRWWQRQRTLVCNATSKNANTLLLADAAGRTAACAQKVVVAATRESAPYTGIKSLSFKIKTKRFAVCDVGLKSRKTYFQTKNVPVWALSWCSLPS